MSTYCNGGGCSGGNNGYTSTRVVSPVVSSIASPFPTSAIIAPQMTGVLSGASLGTPGCQTSSAVSSTITNNKVAPLATSVAPIINRVVANGNNGGGGGTDTGACKLPDGVVASPAPTFTKLQGNNYNLDLTSGNYIFGTSCVLSGIYLPCLVGPTANGAQIFTSVITPHHWIKVGLTVQLTGGFTVTNVSTPQNVNNGTLTFYIQVPTNPLGPRSVVGPVTAALIPSNGQLVASTFNYQTAINGPLNVTQMLPAVVDINPFTNPNSTTSNSSTGASYIGIGVNVSPLANNTSNATGTPVLNTGDTIDINYSFMFYENTGYSYKPLVSQTV